MFYFRAITPPFTLHVTMVMHSSSKSFSQKKELIHSQRARFHPLFSFFFIFSLFYLNVSVYLFIYLFAFSSMETLQEILLRNRNFSTLSKC